MPTIVVTVTATATATSSGDPSSLSPETTAGIIIGSLLGGVLFIALVLYLLNRYNRRKFTRVANHDVSAAGNAPNLPRASSRFTRHLQRPSTSSEPLMPPASWPPLPATPRVLAPDTPPRLDPILPGIGGSPSSSFDFGEISQVVASGTVSRSAIPAQQASSSSSRPGLGDSPPHTRQTSGEGAASPPTTPKPPQNFFIHRMLQSRSQASEGVSLAHRPSLDFSQSRSTTLDSSGVQADEERLLADAERTALRDAERAQGGEEEEMAEREDTESIYSQVSAPVDHSGFLSDPISGPNSSLSVPRRNSSRRQTRTPAPHSDLSPVAEMPDIPGAPAVSAANSSPDGRVSHGTTSRPMSSVVDQSGTLPLLASTNFGKESTASGTSAGSISSTAGWGSSSSGRASRYPSLATSSIGQSSRSGPHSDAGTDWHHPPAGLAGLTSLQLRPLRNPHSPVEEEPDVLFSRSPAGATPVKRAHLREGTAGSMPEVERRDVMQGGIVHIDVAL